MRAACVVAVVMMMGCGGVMRPNQTWLERHEIVYVVKSIPAGSWAAYAQFNGVPINSCGMFWPPHFIAVKEGLEGVCLEHELGHVREHLEGVPMHSKYAR